MKREIESFIEQIEKSGIVNDSDFIKEVRKKIDLDITDANHLFQVLIIEDHLITIEAYIRIFEEIFESLSKYNLIIVIAQSCEEAILKLDSETSYDIILLDIRVPSYPKANIYSGEDISLWIDKNLPVRPKIIVNTYSSDNYRLYNIYQNINPDAFLTKDEASTNLIIQAIKNVILSRPFYTNTVLKMMKSNLSEIGLLDGTDRRLLYELSIRTTIKKIAEILHYSVANVDKRKKKLFIKLNIPDNDLSALIVEAKRRGLI